MKTPIAWLPLIILGTVVSRLVSSEGIMNKQEHEDFFGVWVDHAAASMGESKETLIEMLRYMIVVNGDTFQICPSDDCETCRETIMAFEVD